MITVIKRVDLKKRIPHSPIRGYVMDYEDKPRPGSADQVSFFLREKHHVDTGRNTMRLPRDPEDLAAIARALLEIAYGPMAAKAIEVSEFPHSAERCPSNHWNRGDICADCGTYLG